MALDRRGRSLPAPPHGERAFVGRARELGRLGSLTSGESGACAVLVGEPGIGKTTLLRELLLAAGDGPAPTIWLACGDDAELSLDFGVLDQLVRAAGARAATAREIAEAAPRGPLDVGALVLDMVDGWFAGSGGAERLVVVVDDAHAADEPSLEVLAFLARRLRGSRASLLLATRPEGVRRLPATLLHQAQDAGLLLTLEAFGTADVHALAASLRGSEFAAAAAADVHRRTGGHPLHARILIEQGAGTRDDDSGALPASLNRLVVERSVRCGAGARLLLDAFVVLDGSATLGLAGELGEVPEPLAAAAELRAAGLIELDHAGSVRSGATALARMRHRLLQTAIYDELDPERRRDLHARAARLTDGAASLLHRVAAADGIDADLAADLAAAAEVAGARGARGAGRAVATHGAPARTGCGPCGVAVARRRPPRGRWATSGGPPRGRRGTRRERPAQLHPRAGMACGGQLRPGAGPARERVGAVAVGVGAAAGVDPGPARGRRHDRREPRRHRDEPTRR